MNIKNSQYNIIEGILYIETIDDDNEKKFSVKRELTENEYVKMLREYSSTLDTAYKNFDNYKYNYLDDDQQQNNNKYVNASVIIHDLSNSLCNKNENNNIQKNEFTVFIIQLVDNEIDETFETEFKIWKNDSLKIINDNDINEDDKIRFLPKRDLNFEFENHLYCFLNSKLYNEYDNNKFAIIVENIIEI